MKGKRRKAKVKAIKRKLGIEVLNTWDGYVEVNRKWYPSKEGWKVFKSSLLLFAAILGIALIGILLTDVHMIFE